MEHVGGVIPVITGNDDFHCPPQKWFFLCDALRFLFKRVDALFLKKIGPFHNPADFAGQLSAAHLRGAKDFENQFKGKKDIACFVSNECCCKRAANDH